MNCRYNPDLDRKILSLAETLEERFKLVETQVKVFDRCIDNPLSPGQKLPLPKLKTVGVVKGTETDVKLMYDRIFELEAEQCSKDECVVAVPEWWQVRIGADRPQLAVIYANKLPDGKIGTSRWTVHIPHFAGPANKFPPLPSYQKGSFFAEATLKDNSKIWVNAVSQEEAERVCRELLALVKPDMVPQPIVIHTGKRGGLNLSDSQVTPKYVHYFSKGLKQLAPDWIAHR